VYEYAVIAAICFLDASIARGKLDAALPWRNKMSFATATWPGTVQITPEENWKKTSKNNRD
jgi:hypothetical protein